MSNIGILDPEGKHNNPLTGEPYSDTYKELGKVWSTYPGYDKRAEIIEAIRDHQVVLIQAATGSGKTVLTPKYALHVLEYKGAIAITLPKQLVAKSAAEFAAKTLDVELGKEVGYKYKGSPKEMLSDKTKLLYATDGTIVQKLLNDPELTEFDAVIIDEAHERKVQIDFLLFLLREALKKRPKLKVIIMSATVNADIFKNYYKDFKFKNMELGGKRTFPIDSHFLDSTSKYDDLLDVGFKILVDILKKDDPDKKGAHDIIFFVVSSNDAKTLCSKLKELTDKETKDTCKITCKGDIFCVEVYSGMNRDRQDLAQDKSAFKKDSNYNRKVVIATPVAESSLTIDGLKYVIDSGYQLYGTYDPRKRARRLERELITNAQAKQRMGRAGRTEPGICYHLYTKTDFEDGMEKFPQPDIRISDISDECLKLLQADNIQTTDNLKNVLEQFIEPPKKEYVDTALTTLMQLGATEDSKITKLGVLMSNIATNNIMASSAIIFGKMYNCSREIMKIISMIDAIKINLRELFYVRTDIDEKKAMKIIDDTRKKFSRKCSDHLSLLDIYEEFFNQYKKDNAKQWVRKYSFKFDTLIKAKETYERMKIQVNNLIKEQLDPKNIDLEYNDDIAKLDLEDRILCCLVIGFRTNIAIKRPDGTYRTKYSDENYKMNRQSFTSFCANQPKHVFYHELFISMGRAELNLVSRISDKITEILS